MAGTLNLQVLQRLDSSIYEIIDKASYVAQYDYVQQEWKKQKMEGTLFIFKRSRAPFYGYIVLNRQELENFVDYIYSDTEIELKDELLIIAQVDPSDPHRRFGFWVAEPHLRQHLVNRITEITRQPDNSPSPHSRTRARAYQPNSTSISVDTLFGHAMANAKPASSTSTQSVAQQQQAQTALKPLQQHPPPLNDHAQEPVSKPNPFHIPDHMNPESLFAASSTQGAQRQRQKQPQHPQPQMQQVKVQTHAQTQTQTQTQPKPMSDDERALMAMIGVKPSAPSESQSSPGTSSLNPTTVAKEPSLPPPAVPQETRPPVAPATAVLPRGMDRANFPGELVKALFADPKVADRLYTLYSSGQL